MYRSSLALFIQKMIISHGCSNFLKKQVSGRNTYYFFKQGIENFYLKKLKHNFNYLEIGSYEGNSAIFVAKNFSEAKVYCIDNWNKTNEYLNHKDFLDIENNFDKNVKNFQNIHKLKKSSDLFFSQNIQNFDVIYIDGYHYGSQVYKDCENAWRFLNNDGYLICDDFIWNFYENIKDNPCYAINMFLREIKGQYKIKKISNSQIFVKKISS